MINKRLLIKNLLAHNDENSFYDKKRSISIGEKEGKAKFLKHVCALANTNPLNNSYIVVGVEDLDSNIIGVDFLMTVKFRIWSMPTSIIRLKFLMRTSLFHTYQKIEW